MDKLSMCRICLVEDVKMYSLISANLQELYEKLTDIPFVTKDKKPVQVCYLCRARLQNCYRLQVACLKSEEFLNKVIADSELNEMQLQDLNTLRTVHPLILICCVPSTRKDPEDDKIDEENDFKFDPLEITSGVQVKCEFFEDDSFTKEEVYIKSESTVEEEDICAEDGDMSDNIHTMQDTELEHDIHLKTANIVFERMDLEQFKIDDSFTNEEVYIKSESTVEEEDICAEDGDMSDNIHTMQDTELEHDIHLKSAKIILERIDLEQFKIGRFAAKKPKLSLPNGNTKSTVSTQPQTEGTVVQNNNIEKRIQTMESPAVVRNKIIVEQKSLIKKLMTKKENFVLSSSSSKVYWCVVCEKSLSSKVGLRRHNRIHTGEKPFSCEICEKSFSVKDTLVKHIRIHTGEQPYRCNICEQSFRQKRSLDNHALKHTGEIPYRCNICEKRFIQKRLLANHIRIHSGEKPYRCNICVQSFSQKHSLDYHIRKHTGERPYRCNICEQSFIRQRDLVRHTRIHTGERSYRCNICEKRFTQKSHLVSHIRIHSGEKPYRCNICEQSFSQKHSLNNHTLKHTGERPYRCNICEQSFTRKGHLVVHIRIHSGEKLYRCNICEQSFTQKCHLDGHTRRHTGEKPYKCNMWKKILSEERYSKTYPAATQC